MPNTTPKLSTTQKGLGYDHQVNRDRLLLRHVDGSPCYWCGNKMFRDPSRNFDGKPLEADHKNSRSVHGTAGNRADRLLHKRCNIQRGDGTHDHERPALNPERALADVDDTRELLGDHYYFDWPA